MKKELKKKSQKETNNNKLLGKKTKIDSNTNIMINQKKKAKSIISKEISNIIWIDTNIDNEENILYLKELELIGNFKINCFKLVEKAIEIIKTINFEQTFIIICGKLYKDFIEKFKENLKDIYVIPKIIIFTRNKEKLLNYNKEINYNHPYYNLGGIKTSFDEVKNFILNSGEINSILLKEEDEPQGVNSILLKKEDEPQLIFEYIDCKEKLILPMLYKSLIDCIPIEKVENFTKFLYNKYSKNSKLLEILLNYIYSIPGIPIELLCKFYIRIYTSESNFYIDLNRDLREGKKDMYLPYIKVLYEGIKLQSLYIASNNILFRGSRIAKKEIKIIKDYLDKRNTNLPNIIVFSKSFLSFTKDKKIAENFIFSTENKSSELCKVLFILEKNEDIDYSLSTHADIEKISFYPLEKEVLFFPFSSFEIKEIKQKNINKEIMYEIKILYLGKYLKEFINNGVFVENEKLIPNSEFKNEIIKFGLIKQDNIKNVKQIYQKYENHKKEIENNIKNNNKYNDKYTIIYMSNGDKGEMESNTYTYGDYCIIKPNNFTKKDHTFVGWTTNSNGKGDGYNWTGWSGTWSYSNGQYGIKDNKLILYAIWQPKIKIIYMSNGGKGKMESNTYTYGDYCIIKPNNFTKKDHTFVGWTTNSNGKGDGYNWTGWSGTWSYSNGQYGIKDNKLILYAIWALQ